MSELVIIFAALVIIFTLFWAVEVTTHSSLLSAIERVAEKYPEISELWAFRSPKDVQDGDRQ